MIDSPQTLQGLLAATPLASCQVITLPILETNDVAFAIEIDPGIAVHHYATTLINDKRWFLHERP